MFFLLMDASSVSGRLSFGPELENSVLPSTGVASVPLIAPRRLVEVDALDVVVVDLVHELRVRELGLRRAAAGQAAHDERRGDQREHDPRHPAQRRRAAAPGRGTPFARRSFAGRAVVGRAGLGRTAGDGCRAATPAVEWAGVRWARRNDSGSPVSGSTPGSRSVWRRLILGPAPRRGRSMLRPRAASDGAGSPGSGASTDSAWSTPRVRSIPLVRRRSRSRSHPGCK